MSLDLITREPNDGVTILYIVRPPQMREYSVGNCCAVGVRGKHEYGSMEFSGGGSGEFVAHNVGTHTPAKTHLCCVRLVLTAVAPTTTAATTNAFISPSTEQVESYQNCYLHTS